MTEISTKIEKAAEDQEKEEKRVAEAKRTAPVQETLVVPDKKEEIKQVDIQEPTVSKKRYNFVLEIENCGLIKAKALKEFLTVNNFEFKLKDSKKLEKQLIESISKSCENGDIDLQEENPAIYALRTLGMEKLANVICDLEQDKY